MLRVAVIGQGYVGLPLALKCTTFSEVVYGLDTNASKIETIRSGCSPIEDVSDEVLGNALTLRTYIPTSDLSVISEANVVIICVPTPLRNGNEPDLSFINSALEAITEHAKDDCLIINESTSYPGTLRNIIKAGIDSRRPGARFGYAVAPERIDPGNKTWVLEKTPRIIGALDNESLNAAADFYGNISKSVVKVPSAEVAETAKLLENSFRQVNIALVSEISQYCDQIGINVKDVVDAAATKPFGFLPFYPGIGVGGHCIPIDPLYLAWSARARGLTISLLEKADEINKARPLEIAKRILKHINGQDAKVLVAGLSYKPGIADLRESPALEILQILENHMKNVYWWDTALKNIEGFKKGSLETSYEYAFLMHPFTDKQIEKIVKSSQIVFDCSGRNQSHKGVLPV